jgi:hypothetical protein
MIWTEDVSVLWKKCKSMKDVTPSATDVNATSRFFILCSFIASLFFFSMVPMIFCMCTGFFVWAAKKGYKILVLQQGAPLPFISVPLTSSSMGEYTPPDIEKGKTPNVWSTVSNFGNNMWTRANPQRPKTPNEEVKSSAFIQPRFQPTVQPGFNSVEISGSLDHSYEKDIRDDNKSVLGSTFGMNAKPLDQFPWSNEKPFVAPSEKETDSFHTARSSFQSNE